MKTDQQFECFLMGRDAFVRVTQQIIESGADIQVKSLDSDGKASHVSYNGFEMVRNDDGCPDTVTAVGERYNELVHIFNLTYNAMKGE